MRTPYLRPGPARPPPARPFFSYDVPDTEPGRTAAVLMRARTITYADPSVVEQGSAVLAGAIERARVRAGAPR